MTEYIVAAIQVGGIKCDTKGCDWHDDSVIFNDYPNWVNKSCPKCGGNLLTQKDFKAIVNSIIIADRMNKWCNKWLPEFLLKILTSKIKYHELDMNGSGKIKVKK